MSWVSNALLFVTLWAFTYAALFGLYLAIMILVIDPIEAWLQRHKRIRQQRDEAEREMARIDHEAGQSVQRIQSAFLQAQRLVRDSSDEGRRS